MTSTKESSPPRRYTATTDLRLPPRSAGRSLSHSQRSSSLATHPPSGPAGMDTKLCRDCDRCIRDLFQPGQQRSNSQRLASYNHISKDGNSCPLCALVRTGLRRAFLWRYFVPNLAVRLDVRISDWYTRSRTENQYYDWGQSYPVKVKRHIGVEMKLERKPRTEIVKMRLERNPGAETVVVKLGRTRCRYKIEHLSKAPSVGNSRGLFPHPLSSISTLH